jgi:hypothetical protein
MSSNLNFTFPQKAKTFTYVLMGVGLVSIIAAFICDHPAGADEHYHHNRAWANIFINSFFFMAIGLAAAFFLGLQYATESAWSITVKRVMEAVSWFLPWGLSLMMLLFILGQFGVHHIYPWMDKEMVAHDKIIQAKMGYFGWFWWLRTILYMVAWLWFTYKLRKNSIDADNTADNGHHWKNVTLGAAFMVIFGVTSSTSSWDWLLSIDVHWFSTIYGWYIFSGMWVSAITSIVLIVIYLKKLGYMEFVTESTIHDLGKWMFAISFLWTYLYFSQFMLYWYANIPEEVIYFQQRWENYKPLMWTVFFINFLFPMIMLMSRDAKRNFWFLMFVGMVIFVGHYLDVVMLVMPGTVGHLWTGLSWMEFGIFAGFLGLFLHVVLTNLTKRPLLVKNHPYLEESLHHSI